MDRYVRAIPREKRSKHAIRDASIEAAGLKRKREEQYEKAKQQRKLEGKGPGQPPVQSQDSCSTMQACCWGSAQWGLRNAPEKALSTSIAAQLGVRNGKLFPLKGVRKPRAMHSNIS